jgi:hypothetical protein
MCVQCMMGAMTAGAGASGARAWLGRMKLSWLTPRRLRRITIALVVVALGLSTMIAGTTPRPAGGHPGTHSAPVAPR